GVVPAAALTLEVGVEVLPPDDALLAGIDADQVALLADGVDAVAVNGRGGPEVAAFPADLDGPEDLAGVAVQGEEPGHGPLVAQRVDALAGDGQAGVAAADARPLPHELRPALGPALHHP